MFWDIFYGLCQSKNEKPNNVAQKVKISSGLITKWKQGSIPNTEALIKLSDYFEVSIDYLLGRTDNPKTTNSINNLHTTVNGTQANVINSQESLSEHTDEMTTELLKAFKSLSFMDRLDILNQAIEKTKK